MPDAPQTVTLRFRKKPVVIEARQFDGTPENGAVILGTFDIPGAQWRRIPFDSPLGVITIPTLEGEMMAVSGDWIIRGIKGEFYPCKPDIFAATYEPADAGGAAERGEDHEDAERWRVFAEVVRTTGHVALERFRDGEEERKVLSIEWGDDSTCEPWDFSPLEEWIDARVVAARRASTAPQEKGS